MAQEYVDRELQRVIGNAKRPSELVRIRQLFTDYLGGDISGIEVASKISNCLQSYSGQDRDAIYHALVGVAIQADKIGRETGTKYDRTDLITPQEFALIQSGRGEEGISPTKEPYKPFVLINNPNIDIENLNTHRVRLDHQSAWAFYFGLRNDDFVEISLEPLDEDGNTVRDPVPLDKRGQPITNYTKSPNFPFRRD